MYGCTSLGKNRRYAGICTILYGKVCTPVVINSKWIILYIVYTSSIKKFEFLEGVRRKNLPLCGSNYKDNNIIKVYKIYYIIASRHRTWRNFGIICVLYVIKTPCVQTLEVTTHIHIDHHHHHYRTEIILQFVM